MYIMSNPGCSIKDAHAESGMSYRGFNITLKEMLEAELITLDDDPSDGRRKRVGVGPCGLVAKQYFTGADSGVELIKFAEPEREADDIEV